MARRKTTQQVTWDTGNTSDSVAASGGTVTSDIMLIPSNAIAGAVLVFPNHSGSATADDTCDIFLELSCGDVHTDPDSTANVDFDLWKSTADVTVSLNNTDRVGGAFIEIPACAIAYRIRIINNSTTADAVTVRAQASFSVEV